MNQSFFQTDGQRDRRTDRQTEFSSQRGKQPSTNVSIPARPETPSCFCGNNYYYRTALNAGRFSQEKAVCSANEPNLGRSCNHRRLASFRFQVCCCASKRGPL